MKPDRLGEQTGMANPQVSVIIPTYNRQDCLPYAVQSVLAQEEADFEIILVDDASTDGTGAMGWEELDPRIRCLRLPARVGAQAARNAGLAHGRGELIAFLDSDDILLPGSLAFRCRYFQAHPECESSYSDYEVSFAGLQPRLLKQVRLGGIPPRELYRRALQGLKLGPFIVIMVRKAALLEAGGLDPALPASHDDDFYLRFAGRGACHYIPGFAARIIHQPGESITGDPRNIADGRRLLIEKYSAPITEALGIRGLQRHLLDNAFDYLRARDWQEYKNGWRRARSLGPLPLRVIAGVLGGRLSLSVLRAARNGLYKILLRPGSAKKEGAWPGYPPGWRAGPRPAVEK